MFRQRTQRRQQGAVAMAILLLMLAVTLAVMSFAYDYAHGVMVKECLQSATDAGALAGAMELAHDDISATHLTNARNFATEVAALNKIENLSVSNSTPGTTVSVSVNAASVPRTVTVTAVRNVETLFARGFGWHYIPVSSTSTAAADKGILKVMPNQLMPLAISLDHRPEKGPQRDIALQDTIASGQPFHIILNPKKNKNSSWVKEWAGTNSPLITLGADALTMNGVVANQVKALKPGDTFNLPLITGKPPFNNCRKVVGVIGFEITRINFPLSIEGTIKNAAKIKGTPGRPSIPGLTLEGQTFLDKNQPWHVSLAY